MAMVRLCLEILIQPQMPHRHLMILQVADERPTILHGYGYGYEIQKFCKNWDTDTSNIIIIIIIIIIIEITQI